VSRSCGPKEHSVERLPVSIAKRFDLALASAEPRAGQLHGRPYEGLSRMRGNLHVRFLGGCGRATACTYPTLRRGETPRLATCFVQIHGICVWRRSGVGPGAVPCGSRKALILSDLRRYQSGFGCANLPGAYTVQPRRRPGAGPAQARRVPDVDCVRYCKRVIYVINSRSRGSAYYILISHFG
jgi:hypothetical protein